MQNTPHQRNIFLVGFMGAGKSSVGKALAKILGIRFLDLDDAVEKELKIPIAEIFARFGEEYFRDAESAALKSVSIHEAQVVATGGGAALREENWQAMRRSGGVTVYLRAPAEALWNRVKGNQSRPLLRVENPFERLVEMLDSRIPLYEKADIAVNTEGLAPESVASLIARELLDIYPGQ
ncbi:MAG: shikimate kinase [Deltaproteobacteria bacterium]